MVENRPGVLHNISGLFSRRGFNIDSLAVGTTENPDVSRMTIVVDAEDQSIEQVTKQLNKLVNVLKISILDPESSIDRELVLIKIHSPSDKRAEILALAELFRTKIIDVAEKSLTIEATGTADKLKALEDLCRSYGIIELARTGKIALSRGRK